MNNVALLIDGKSVHMFTSVDAVLKAMSRLGGHNLGQKRLCRDRENGRRDNGSFPF
jgi:hypothetical protein